MAMLVKPEGVDLDQPHIRLISGSLIGGLEIRQQLALKDLIHSAVHGGDTVSKYKPSGGKVKTKLVSKKRKSKTVVTQQQKVKPVLSANDDERYAMWWAFHTDMTKGEYPSWKGMKVKSIDASTKERELAKRQSLMSRSSKAKILNYQAVGITPDSQRKRRDLIGSACHPSDQVGYGKVVANNKSYEQELVSRYVEKSQVAKAIPLVFGYLDHLQEVIQPIVKISDSVVDMDDVIFKLQTIVEQDKVEPLVLADQPPWETSQQTLLKATAEVFDMDLADVLPSAAANDSIPPGVPVMVSDPVMPRANWTIAGIESLAQEQWSLWHEGIYREMCAHSKEYRGTSVAKYMVARRRADKQQRIDSVRYLNWLRDHDSSQHRDYVESTRKVAVQDYQMDVGMQVHPLYHGGKKSYDNMIEVMQHRRIAAFDYGLMGNECFGTWFKRTKAVINVAKNTEFFITDQVNKEALVDKLIANAIVQKDKEQLSFKQWAYMVESQYLPTVETTTVSESSPSTPVAEVVDLNSFRAKRTNDVGSLLAKLKPKLSNLTEEQKEGVRIAMDLLNEMMG